MSYFQNVSKECQIIPSAAKPIRKKPRSRLVRSPSPLNFPTPAPQPRHMNTSLSPHHQSYSLILRVINQMKTNRNSTVCCCLLRCREQSNLLNRFKYKIKTKPLLRYQHRKVLIFATVCKVMFSYNYVYGEREVYKLPFSSLYEYWGRGIWLWNRGKAWAMQSFLNSSLKKLWTVFFYNAQNHTRWIQMYTFPMCFHCILEINFAKRLTDWKERLKQK